MATKTPTADEITELNIWYRQCEHDVLELLDLTESPRWAAIWNFIQSIKKACERSACDVEDSKELARIKAIYDTIQGIINKIIEPVKALNDLIENNENTLFAFDLDTFYRWDHETGRVIVKTKNGKKSTDISFVTISCPQTGQSVTTTTEKIQKLADQMMGKKHETSIPAKTTA